MSHRDAATIILSLFLTNAAAASSGLSIGGPAPAADCVESEPNNSPDSGNAFPLPGSCTGSAASTDPNAGWFLNYPDGTKKFFHDFWSIDIASSTTLDVTLTFTAAGNLDMVLTDETLSTFRGFSISATGTSERI